MRAMLVAVLVLAGCGGEGGGDDGAGGMGGAPGAGGAPAAVDPLTAIRECQEVEGEAPCCPDPAVVVPIADDGETLDCPEGTTLEDNTTPQGDRVQACANSAGSQGSLPRMRYSTTGRVTFETDDEQLSEVEFGWSKDGADNYVCDGFSGRIAMALRRDGNGQCLLACFISHGCTFLDPCP